MMTRDEEESQSDKDRDRGEDDDDEYPFDDLFEEDEEDPLYDLRGDDGERRETSGVDGHRGHSRLSLDETARLVRARAHLNERREPISINEPVTRIMESVRQPTLPGISLDPTATINTGPDPRACETRIIMPRRGEIFLLRIGAYSIKGIQDDCIVVEGKGVTTGERLIPIASLERAEGVDVNYVWRFKEGHEKTLQSFPRADGQGFGPMRQRS